MATILPVAVKPTAIHTRITVQRGAFTIWGSEEVGLDQMVGERILRRFVINDRAIPFMRSQLEILGTTWVTLFPDLDNLAKDLAARY